MSNEEKTLKPGDRVRLTGWSSKIAETEHFDGEFPCIAEFDREFLVTNNTQKLYWLPWRFTYEKIQDDGNG